MKRIAIYLVGKRHHVPGDLLVTKAGRKSRLLRVESVTVRQLGLGREQQRLVCVELVPHLVTIRRATRVRR